MVQENEVIMLDCFLRQNAGLYAIWVVHSLNRVLSSKVVVEPRVAIVLLRSTFKITQLQKAKFINPSYHPTLIRHPTSSRLPDPTSIIFPRHSISQINTHTSWPTSNDSRSVCLLCSLIHKFLDYTSQTRLACV